MCRSSALVSAPRSRRSAPRSAPRPVLRLLASLALLSPSVALAEDELPPLSIYGFARLDILVNDSLMSGVEQPGYVMSEPASGRLENTTTMTPRLSRIGLGIDEWDLDDDGDLTGRGTLEVDFGGGTGTSAIRLRHAYGAVKSRRVELLAGQTWDLVSPLFPSAQTDMQLLQAGNIGDRRPQVRLSASPNRNIQLGLSLSTAASAGPTGPTGMPAEGEPEATPSSSPMLQWLIEGRSEKGDGAPRMGVSGHVMRTDHADGTSQTTASVGGHLYLPIARKFALLGESFAGTNLAELGGGIGQRISAMTGRSILSMGGWAELAAMPTARHLFAVGSSIELVPARDLATGERKRNSTIYTVLRYKPNPSLQLGIEHLYWRTEYVNMTPGVANRVDANFSVFF